METNNFLPSCETYLKYLNIASLRFNLSIDECRNRFGLFTNLQWMQLFSRSYSIQYNIGRAKYVVNFNDGISKYEDGSDFIRMQICKNKKQLQLFTNGLKSQYYQEN